MNRSKRNITALGAMVAAAAALFVWLLYFLLGDPILAGGTQFFVRMDDGGGLKRGDAVEVSGVQVGTVRTVHLDPPNDVTVEVQVTTRDLGLRADTRATVMGDVFGKHSIVLLPGSALVELEEGDTIRGVTQPQLTDMAADLSIQARSVLTGADSLLSPSTVRHMRQAMANLPGATEQLTAAFAELRLAAMALRRATSQIEDANAAGQLTATLEELERTAQSMTRVANSMETSLDGGLTRFESIMAKIDEGDGTLGRLVNDTSLYGELELTIREMRFLTADIRARPERYLKLGVF